MAIRPPGVQLGLEGVDTAQLLVRVAVDRQAFFFFPAVEGADGATEVGGDLFPGVEQFTVPFGDAFGRWVELRWHGLSLALPGF
jgi:hypothetical protein